MSEMPRPDILELEVSNFGPIVEAKVDLRPLTVFVGPSNTGKSYLAILIYALHRHFSGGGWPGRRRFAQDSWGFRGGEPRGLSGEDIDSLIELANQILSGSEESLPDKAIVLPGSTVDFVRAEFDYQGGHLGNEIGRCFGIEEAGALLRKGSKGSARIVFHRHVTNDSAPIDHRLTISAHASEFKTIIPEGAQMRIGVGDDDYLIDHFRDMAMGIVSPGHQGEELWNFLVWEMLEDLIGRVLPQIGGPLAFPAFYLPADRTGVMHAHSVVVSALIGSAAMTGLRPAARTPMLSGVLADFLERLIQIDRPGHGRRGRQHDLGREIEKTILGGSVGIVRSQAIGYPHFTYRPKEWKEDLSLMHASSMVSELAPVVLYLRHVIVPGNVLIVEEPESHLHPAMQVEFTRQLAALVHAGVRVIVTTHSEWVLEELANIVSRSGLAETEREGAGGKGIALHPDQVGAWLFKPKGRPKGSVVEEVKLDKETGLYPTDYDAVSEALYNESARIFNRIQDGKVG